MNFLIDGVSSLSKLEISDIGLIEKYTTGAGDHEPKA
jgi:hypothetical protein